mmetsp:Transcript_7320/g.16751  ORF Transcript_7320/g.16751 Transcript_7320/m.16751 type:complete len:285 (-) Transcript_7320:825-1679(-)
MGDKLLAALPRLLYEAHAQGRGRGRAEFRAVGQRVSVVYRGDKGPHQLIQLVASQLEVAQLRRSLLLRRARVQNPSDLQVHIVFGDLELGIDRPQGVHRGSGVAGRGVEGVFEGAHAPVGLSELGLDQRSHQDPRRLHPGIEVGQLLQKERHLGRGFLEVKEALLGFLEAGHEDVFFLLDEVLDSPHGRLAQRPPTPERIAHCFVRDGNRLHELRGGRCPEVSGAPADLFVAGGEVAPLGVDSGPVQFGGGCLHRDSLQLLLRDAGPLLRLFKQRSDHRRVRHP